MLEIGPAPAGHVGLGRLRDKHQRGKSLARRTALAWPMPWLASVMIATE